MKTWIGSIVAGVLALSACSSGSETGVEQTSTEQTTPQTSDESRATATTALPATTAPPAATIAASVTTAPVSDRTPAEILYDSVDASLAARSFSADVLFDVRLFDQTLTLTADASIDYQAIVTDAVFTGDIDGVLSELEVRADGTSLWVRGEGGDFPSFPAGALWVEGEADRLAGGGTLDPAGVLGALIVLRGAETVEVIGTELSIDGTEVTRYATSIPYEDALAAAGELADEFQRAISLNGLPAVLDIQVTIGPDDVVRSFDATIGVLENIATEQPIELDGVYTISLIGVGEPVTPPIAPNPALVAVGPDAELLLDQLLG